MGTSTFASESEPQKMLGKETSVSLLHKFIQHKQVSINDTIKIVKGHLASKPEKPSDRDKPYEDPADPTFLKQGMALQKDSVSLVHFGEKDDLKEVSKVRFVVESGGEVVLEFVSS